MRKLGSVVRKLRISPASLIVLKKDTELAKNIVQMAQIITDMKIANVALVVVDDIYKDVTIMNETEMAKLGWFRISALNHLIRIPPNGLKPADKKELAEDKIDEVSE